MYIFADDGVSVSDLSMVGIHCPVSCHNGGKKKRIKKSANKPVAAIKESRQSERRYDVQNKNQKVNLKVFQPPSHLPQTQ